MHATKCTHTHESDAPIQRRAHRNQSSARYGNHEPRGTVKPIPQRYSRDPTPNRRSCRSQSDGGPTLLRAPLPLTHSAPRGASPRGLQSDSRWPWQPVEVREKREPDARGAGLSELCRAAYRRDVSYHDLKLNMGFMLEAKGSVEPEAWNRLSVLYHLAWPSVRAMFRPSLCQG